MIDNYRERERERERERVICRFCEKQHYGSQRVCRDCIDKHRPKLSTFWLVFWFLFSFFGAFIYYFLKKNSQEEWDRKNF